MSHKDVFYIKHRDYVISSGVLLDNLFDLNYFLLEYSQDQNLVGLISAIDSIENTLKHLNGGTTKTLEALLIELVNKKNEIMDYSKGQEDYKKYKDLFINSDGDRK